MKSKYIYLLPGLLLLWIFVAACEDDKYEVPAAKREFQNDCIKRSLGPNLVNNTLEFAYAMALPADMGSILSAQVEASIAGAAGTNLENRAFSTDGGGNDKPVQIGDPSSTEGNLTTVTFARDTFAVTLRYSYKIPEEARGQNVSFTFSATDSNGKTVKMEMGPYVVASMDMVLDSIVTDNTDMYISISDMAIYNAAQAAANPDKIDLVYLYRTLPQPPPPAAAVNFAHALVAPAADPIYLPGVTLPAGVNNDTKVIKTLNLRDQHLARLQFGVYIDDVDFRNLDTSTASNFATNLKGEAGAWIETADGQYRAFIYINAVATAPTRNMRISIKRLKMF
jgi:hypothetical protein